MPAPVRLTVIGSGLIGRRHIESIIASPDAVLASIVDPTPAARALAQSLGVEWFAAFADIPAGAHPDGAIVATPNQMHVSNGLDCIAAGVAALIEKPIADDVTAAELLVDAAERDGIPLLVGHHRRHNPMIQRAKAEIDSGRLGRIVAVQGMFWLMKSADYFMPEWRRSAGAGPVLINLSHDVDLLRYLVGEVVAVQAASSNAQRGFAVEDTAAVILHFAGGALGTFSLSDTIQAPWSWEFTTGESPIYSPTQESCYRIGGTNASLSVPQLDVWHHPAAPSWWVPIERERLVYVPHDPMARQIANFVGVLRGKEKPVVSGREGLNTLKVIAAIQRAIASGGVENV